MKQTIFTFLLTLLPLAASADAVKIGDLYYYLDPYGLTAILTNNPSGAKYSGIVTIPAEVCYEGIPGEAYYEENYANKTFLVTTIGVETFAGCSELTSVSIPNSVTEIGQYAFKSCTGLKDIYAKMPNPFEIKEVVFDAETYNNAVLHVDSNVDSYRETFAWSKFFHIVNGEDTPGVGDGGKDSDNYKTAEPTELSVGDTFTADMSGTIGIFAVNGSKTVTLSKCGNVSSVEVPSTITYNGVEYTVTGIQGTETGNVYKPNNSVFGSNVTEVIIPSTVISIGACAFYYCENLTSVTIPNSVTAIGDDAFLGCTKLSSITLPSNLKTIGEYAFSRCSLSSVTIPASVTEIGFGAFQIDGIKVNTPDLTAFAKITPIEDRDARIYGSFYPNWKLYVNNAEVTSLSIPESVMSVSAIFAFCTSLTSLTCHKDVTTIAKGAFVGCSNITKVEARMETPVNISGFVHFDDAVLKAATLVVPKGTTAAYKSAGWNFTNIEEDGPMGLKVGDVFGMRGVPGTYRVTSANTVALCKWSDSDGKKASIPTTVTYTDGTIYTVTSIGGTETGDSGKPYFPVFVGNVESITIPSTVTEIGGCMAYETGSLTSITIPATVTSIGQYAFAYSALTNVTVEHGTPLSISENTFNGVYDNATLIVPAGKVSVYKGATGWKSFKTIKDVNGDTGDPDPQPNTLKDGDAFQATVSGQAWNFKVLSASGKTCQVGINTPLGDIRNDYWGDAIVSADPMSITVPSKVKAGDGTEFTVTAIGEGAFTGYNMESVTLPNTIKEIDYMAFAWCRYMKSISLPEGLTSIGMQAFDGNGLPSVEIPSTVTSIGVQAFWGMRKLTDVITKIANPFALKTVPFSDPGTLTLTVPAGKVSIYKSTEGWKDFGTIKDVNGDTGEPQPEQAITVTAKSYSRVYGDANPTFEYTSEGGTLSGTPTVSCVATATSPVGTYDIVVAKGSVTNGSVTYVKGTLTITKAQLKIKAGSYTKKQGEENPTFTLTYEGFKNNETEAVLTKKPTVSCSATKDSPAGDYDVTVSGAEAKNYEISYTKGKLTVTSADGPQPEATITITAKSYSRVYGDANPTFEYTTEGGTLSGTPTVSCAATVTSPVGTYDIVVAKGSVTNGSVTYVKGTLTITKAPLKIKAGSYTKKKGEENPTFTLTYKGFKNNETEAVLTKKPTVSCSATKDSPVGDYDVIVSGAEAENYDISYSNGIMTISEEATPESDPVEEFTEREATYIIGDGNSVTVDIDNSISGKYEIKVTVTHDGKEYKVTAIAEGAFENQTGLTEITIPGSVVTIGENAFAGCRNLTAIYIYVTTPVGLGTSGTRTRASGAASVFDGVDMDNCVLYVPQGCVDAYRAAEGWNEFKNIVEMGSTGISRIVSDGQPFDIYNLQGRKVRSGTTSFHGLPKGVYIVNGRKVTVTK